jgi:hypothetical protein
VLAVYDGRTCIGHLLNRGKDGIEAFDSADRTLGIYLNLKSACDAIARRAPS